MIACVKEICWDIRGLRITAGFYINDWMVPFEYEPQFEAFIADEDDWDIEVQFGGALPADVMAELEYGSSCSFRVIGTKDKTWTGTVAELIGHEGFTRVRLESANLED